MRDEEPLFVLQRLPVLQVLGQIHLDEIQEVSITRHLEAPPTRILISVVTSSAVQKEASAFLYICQMSWYLMGKMTKRRGLSFSRGSSSTSLPLFFTAFA